jgi:uncharacterized protein
MKIELKRTAEDFCQKVHLEEAADTLKLQAEEVKFVKSVKVDLLISKSKDQLICRGEITAPVVLECSRCLLEYELDLTSNLSFVIDLVGIPNQIDSEDDSYFLADPSQASFVIDDLVREAIIVSLPLKPLCTEACRGLCPVCGTDLNKSECHCVIEKADPRWDKLKGILQKDNAVDKRKR